jgi:hypothetical protein
MSHRRSSIISLTSTKGSDGFLSKLKLGGRNESKNISSTDNLPELVNAQVIDLREDNYEAIIMDASKDVLVEYYWPGVPLASCAELM